MTSTEEKLQHAQEWMRREILAQKNHIWDYARNEDDILQALQAYFSQEAFLSLSESCIRELISSEILFDTLSLHPSIDGSWVILGYQKVFDTLIENFVTKWYRKYIRKLWKLQKPINTPLEKSLYQVVEKWFIFSAGRLYEIQENIKKERNCYEEKNIGFYEVSMKAYISENTEIKKCLIQSDFFVHLEVLMKKKILWEKRHSWILSYDDTLLARKLYIWDLRDTNSLLWILASIWGVRW